MLKNPVVILGKGGMLAEALIKEFAENSPVALSHRECDITNLEKVKKVLNRLRPSIVINAAAYNAVDEAETTEGFRTAMAVNGLGPKNLAIVCSELGAALVHYSTDYVFSGEKNEEYPEDARPNPKSKYGTSKLAGEKNILAILNATQKNKKIPRFYVIRTCRLFGPTGRSEHSKKSFVDIMLDLVKQNKEIKVVNAELASPTYVKDLATQTKLLLAKNYPSGIYHITNSGSCTWYEFAKEIFRLSGLKIALKAVPNLFFLRSAPRPQYSILINSKLPRMRSWQKGLEEYLSFYRKVLDRKIPRRNNK